MVAARKTEKIPKIENYYSSSALSLLTNAIANKYRLMSAKHKRAEFGIHGWKRKKIGTNCRLQLVFVPKMNVNRNSFVIQMVHDGTSQNPNYHRFRTIISTKTASLVPSEIRLNGIRMQEENLITNYNASQLQSGHNLAQSQISFFPLFYIQFIRSPTSGPNEKECTHTHTPHNDNCFYGYSVSECKLEISKNFIHKKVQKWNYNLLSGWRAERLNEMHRVSCRVYCKCADVLNSVFLFKTEWSVIILLCDSDNLRWMKKSVFIIIFSRFCFCTDAPENVWSGKKWS